MSDPELKEVIMRLKDQGNVKFRERAFKDAVDEYKDAIEHT